MIETFAALLLGHVLADFVLQTDGMVDRKSRWWVLILHGLIVYGATALTAGHPVSVEIALLSFAHLAIDTVKSACKDDRFHHFILDQAAHFATLVAVAVLAPDLWSTGLWSAHPAIPAIMLLTAGAIFAVRAGGFAIDKLLATVETPEITEPGLPNAGALIGVLERFLIYLLILAGQPAGVGFLIAAKSVLRFSSTQDGNQRQISEYIIVGTLASFGWAMTVAFGVEALLTELPPIF